jgi:hypothetical protein
MSPMTLTLINYEIFFPQVSNIAVCSKTYGVKQYTNNFNTKTAR